MGGRGGANRDAECDGAAGVGGVESGGDGGLRRRQVDGVQRVGGVEEEEG